MKGMLLKIPLFIQSTILSFLHTTANILLSPFSSPPPNHCSISSVWKGGFRCALAAPHFSSKHSCRRREREKQNHICFVDRKAENKISPGHARTSSPFAMLGNDQFIVAIRSSIHPSIHTRAPCEFIHTRSGSAYTPFFCRSEKAAVLVGDNKALSLLRVYACLLW